MTNKEVIEVLQSMKSDFPLPKAAQTRRAQNDALDAAIKALKAEPRDDTISRQAALNSPVTMVSDGLDWIPAYHIKGLPSAQSERKKGYWLHEKIISSNSERGFFLLPECTCAECNIVIAHEANYCPNCGADMRGEQDG